MANWYVSSAGYAALTAWTAAATITVGTIRVPTAPTANNRWAFRCSAITTGITGGVQPTWPAAQNGTVVDGGVTWTNVTGQAAYGWGACGGDLGTVTGDGSAATAVVAGDTVYVSSDHSESFSAGKTWLGNVAASFTRTLVISVNRAGSVPPVAGDITSGATFISSTSTITLESPVPYYLEGLVFNSALTFYFNNGTYKGPYMKNCSIVLTGANFIQNNNPSFLVLDNTTIGFGTTAGHFQFGYGISFTWINTPSAIVGAAVPTYLFGNNSGPSTNYTLRGVDLSAMGSGKTIFSDYQAPQYILLDSCRINAAVTRYTVSVAYQYGSILELVNCFDGTNIINERYQMAGSLVTERTIVLTSGAADDVGAFSHKLVSASTDIDFLVNPLTSFWMDVENTLVGSSHTATVQIVSSTSGLTNTDVALYLEYQGTVGSSVASFASNAPITPLTASSALTASGATWASSPATPNYYQLQVTFTPQVAGRVRGQVRMGRVSTTIYVNPQITIT